MLLVHSCKQKGKVNDWLFWLKQGNLLHEENPGKTLFWKSRSTSVNWSIFVVAVSFHSTVMCITLLILGDSFSNNLSIWFPSSTFWWPSWQCWRLRWNAMKFNNFNWLQILYSFCNFLSLCFPQLYRGRNDIGDQSTNCNVMQCCTLDIFKVIL